MSQWLCGKRAWLNDISLIAPLGSLPSSWSIPRSNCPRLTLTSHKIGRNCQKNGRYWDQEVDLLTFTYNLHQLTSTYQHLGYLGTCLHAGTSESAFKSWWTQTSKIRFQAAIVLALPKAREQDSWYCTIHTWKTCLEPCDEHDWDLRPFLGIFDTRHCIHHVIQSAFTEDLLLSVHPSAQTLKG